MVPLDRSTTTVDTCCQRCRPRPTLPRRHQHARPVPKDQLVLQLEHPVLNGQLELPGLNDLLVLQLEHPVLNDQLAYQLELPGLRDQLVYQLEHPVWSNIYITEAIV